MAREYPRVEETRHQPKWVAMGPNKGPKCCVCGAKAVASPWVQVNWFRGEDEGPFKACKEHKSDAQALLNSTTKKETT